MTKNGLSRRDFNRLSMAALSGMVAGSLVGCPQAGDGDGEATPPANGGDGEGAAPSDPAAANGAAAEEGVALLTEEPHVCRGLNTCQGKEAEQFDADNACAGQGECATAEHHSCHGENACKGQGGCGEAPGQNACEGKGECAVPLSNDAWTKAREAFEKALAEAGKEVGPAPPKP